MRPALPSTARDTLLIVALDRGMLDEPTGEISRMAAEQMTTAEWGRLGGQAGRGESKRHPIYGEANGAARLTEQSVRRMRALAAAGWRVHQIAEAVGVNWNTAAAVLAGRTWGQVE